MALIFCDYRVVLVVIVGEWEDICMSLSRSGPSMRDTSKMLTYIIFCC